MVAKATGEKDVTATAAEDVSIRPFRFSAPEDDLVELRRRIQGTRWPDKETVSDRSQGVQLAKLRRLVEYFPNFLDAQGLFLHHRTDHDACRCGTDGPGELDFDLVHELGIGDECPARSSNS